MNLELSWRAAAVAAAGLGAAAAGLRLAGRRSAAVPDSAPDPRQAAGRLRPAGRLWLPSPARLRSAAVTAQETALVLGLFALWQLAGFLAAAGPGGALGRSRWIWSAERIGHLPSEAALQRVFLPHPLIVEFLNLYYASLHFPVLIACMIWLFFWHRERYARMRVTLVAVTGGCLLIQLMPVAPPRMLPATGMVDTAARYGQSVYAAHAGFEPDQLSAMPSVHVAWAILVAIAVIGAARSRWRWLAVLYPAMTTLAVVVTANHYWLDGIVAAAVLGVVLLGQAGGRRLLAARSGAPLFPEMARWDTNPHPAGTGGSNGNGSSSGRTAGSAPGRHRPA